MMNHHHQQQQQQQQQQVQVQPQQLQLQILPPQQIKIEEEKKKPNLIFHCKLCNKNFARSDCLRRHNLMFHEVIKPYSCDVCSKAFARMDILNRHKKTHGPRNTLPPPPPQQPPNTNVYSVYNMFMHQDGTGQNRMVYQLPTQPLPLHQVATSVAPNNIINMTQQPPKKRRRKTPQQPRNRNHDPNAIFPCEVCDKTFTRNDCLRRHNLMFHEENKPYTCDVCHKSFARPDLLNRHKKGHTRENESYACALCGSKFTRKDSLTRHNKKMHKELGIPQVQVQLQGHAW